MSVGKLERRLREHRHASNYWHFFGDSVLEAYHLMMAEEIEHLIKNHGDIPE